MRDAAVVTDEKRATPKPHRELRQRKILRHADSFVRQKRSQSADSLQRARQLPRRVFRAGNLRRTSDQIAHATALEVGRKDLVRIKKITDDLVKAAEVIDQLPRKLSVTTKEARESSIFD